MDTQLIAEVENKMNESVNPLEGLIKNLETQRQFCEDLVVPSGHVRFDTGSGMLMVADTDVEHGYGLTELAHEQIGQKLEIPTAYYRKLKSEFPELLGQNINGWLSKKERTKYLLRTFNYGNDQTQNICRAMLSNKYNILDNFDVLVTALEAIQKTGIHVEIVKAEVTERRMYLHVVAPEIHIQATELLDGYLADRKSAKTGEGIISGFVISNSEVGVGSFEISARAQILQCLNGMHDRTAKFRKVHLGARLEEGIIEWSDSTKNKNYDLICSQTQDAVKTYLSKDYLGNLVSRLAKYKEQVIEHPSQVIEKIGQELQISDEHRQSVLKHFLRDNDETTFGMMNAVTRMSQNLDADSQFNVEAGIFDLLPRMKSFDKQVQSKN